MEDKSLKHIWKAYDAQLQRNMDINLKIFQDLQLMKTKSSLKNLRNKLVREMFFFVGILTLITDFIATHYPTPQFVGAGLAVGVFFMLGIIGSIGQLFILASLDYSQPITFFQQQLTHLKSYQLRILRGIFLTVPLYFAYIIIGFKVLFDVDIVAEGDTLWLWSQIMISVLFIPLSIWIVRNLRYDTSYKWMKKLILNSGGKQVQSALIFLGEIDELKRETETG